MHATRGVPAGAAMTEHFGTRAWPAGGPTAGGVVTGRVVAGVVAGRGFHRRRGGDREGGDRGCRRQEVPPPAAQWQPALAGRGWVLRGISAGRNPSRRRNRHWLAGGGSCWQGVGPEGGSQPAGVPAGAAMTEHFGSERGRQGVPPPAGWWQGGWWQGLRPARGPTAGEVMTGRVVTDVVAGRGSHRRRRSGSRHWLAGMGPEGIPAGRGPSRRRRQH